MKKGLLSLFVLLLLSGCSKPDTNDEAVSATKPIEKEEPNDSSDGIEKAESNDSPDGTGETYELNGWHKMEVEFYDFYDNPPSAVAPLQVYEYVYKDDAVCQVYYYVDIFEEQWKIKIDSHLCFKVSTTDLWYANMVDNSLETNVWGEKGVYKIISSSKESLCFELDEKKMGKFTKSYDEELHSLFDDATPMDIDKVYDYLYDLFFNQQ